MAALIPPMLKYSTDLISTDFDQICVKIHCKVLYFKAQYLLKLRSPLNGLIGHFLALAANSL